MSTDVDLKPKLHFERFEFKYPMPADLIERIVPDLMSYMVWDPYVAARNSDHYDVTSLYYENANFDVYNEKVAGVKKRKKLRLRFYGQEYNRSDPIFCEIKRRDDSTIIKDRFPLAYSQCQDLLKGQNAKQLLNHSDLPKETIKEFLVTVKQKGLFPRVLVTYKRKPLIGKFDDNFRITLDSEIKASVSNNLDAQRWVDIYPRTAILELKFYNALPEWFGQLIQQHSLDRQAFSKYANSAQILFNLTN